MSPEQCIPHCACERCAERAAHAAILDWCRSYDGKREVNGMPCMRVLPDRAHVVVDNARFDSPRLVSAVNWTQALIGLRAAGYTL